jgi:hypothetical protein
MRQELDIIFKYSPFKTKNDLIANFDEITEPNGTLIMIHDLRLHSDGESELDFETDQYDIQVRDMRVDLSDSK